MADPLDDIERMLKSLRDAGRRDAEMLDLFSTIKQALVDVLDRMEKKDKEPPEPPPVVNVEVAAPVVNVAPVIQSDWTTLEIDAPVDGLGRPTGKMTIKKVK